MEGMKERRVCMIQRSLWKRPALQTSEAVLLPALPRMKAAEPGLFRRVSSRPAYRRPLPPGEETPRTALSTYVRPRAAWRAEASFGPSVLARIPICVEKRKADGRAGGRGAFPDGKPKRDRTTPVSFPICRILTNEQAGSRRHIPGCRSIRRYRPSSTDYQECWCGVRCWT